ncbi:MAG: nitroreductase family protein [Pseudonocardiales bacterium]|nr:nitroreductase family protein [Pseudonocardiales bacterium]
MDEDGFYQVLHRHRDVLGEFTGAPPCPEVLRRIRDAAHAAPSVGHGQPWAFILVGNQRTPPHVPRARAAGTRDLRTPA